MSPILQKLHTLQDQLDKLADKQHATLTELAHLKNRPNNDAKNEARIRALGEELARTKDQLAKANDSLEDSFAQIQRYDEQNIALTKQNNQLQNEISEQKQQIATLQEKNRLAGERAEAVKTWLINIDNQSV